MTFFLEIERQRKAAAEFAQQRHSVSIIKDANGFYAAWVVRNADTNNPVNLTPAAPPTRVVPAAPPRAPPKLDNMLGAVVWIALAAVVFVTTN